MLEKETVKKLTEHDWLTLNNRDPNPTQTLARLRGQANKAINELVLLADKLPDNTQRQIFSHSNIEKLVQSILKESFDMDPEGEARRAHLAALLVKEGISLCSKYYETQIEENPILNQPLLEQLHKARNFCEEIAFKMDSLIDNEERTLLVSWPLTRSDYERPHGYKRIQDFVRNTMCYKSGYKGMWRGGSRRAKDGLTSQGMELDAIDGNGLPYTFEIEVSDDDRTKGVLRICDEDDKCIYEEELIAKEENKTLYIYRKTNEIPRLFSY